jgi:hypothetical protein
MPTAFWSFGRREIRMGDKKEGTMREIPLCLRFKRARDRSSSRDEVCRPTQTGDHAMPTSNTIPLCSCPPRSLRLFHFLSGTAAHTNRMVPSAHPESLNMLARISRVSLMPQKTQGSRSCRSRLTGRGRCPIHAEPRHRFEQSHIPSWARYQNVPGLPLQEKQKPGTHRLGREKP